VPETLCAGDANDCVAKFRDPAVTAEGERRATVSLSGLKTLWIIAQRPARLYRGRGGRRVSRRDSIEQFELGSTLSEASRPVALNHPHCAKFCVLGGAKAARRS